MPELPEVEILVRNLAPQIKGKKIRGVEVRRARVIAPTSERNLKQALRGATFTGLTRRGKYLVFALRAAKQREPLRLIGHLGMTGRMYLLPKGTDLPKHAAVVLDLGARQLIYEDTRYFGRFTLDARSVDLLGPEPLEPEFTVTGFADALKRSGQAIKIKLLDQTLIAGVGNIHASEALFRAGISPKLPARKLNPAQVRRLWQAIRAALSNAIEIGVRLPLDFSGGGRRDGLFYYGSAKPESEACDERFLVYDRAGLPCPKCGTAIRRIVQGARGTFYCSRCQPAKGACASHHCS